MKEMHKVVRAEEMARIEKIAYDAGALERDYMLAAGRGVADAVIDYILLHALEKQVFLLIGKGNNGGDAFAAGSELLSRGYTVKAACLYSNDQCSPLCQEQAARFRSAGGEIVFFPTHMPRDGIILDGITGTGFRGKAEGVMLDAIHAANDSQLPILSIDIPSGVSGNTGAVESSAIHASQTLYLGLPKIGFFLGEGWNHAGDLKGIDFGLDPKAVDQARAEAILFHPDGDEDLLPLIKRTRHKYERGYLLAVAGSDSMPGAAILSSFAAMRAGAGMVRLFHQCSEMRAPYEIMHEPADGERILVEAQRAKALFVGPGLGRSSESKKLVKFLFNHSPLPCVIDADALYFLAEHPSWKIRGHAILTPHHGEMSRLLEGAKPDFTNCQAYVEKHKVTLVLKGAPSIVFEPGMTPLIIPRGDPGMATAGAGDVLTGVIAAFLAQGLAPYQAAISGVFVHALAGESAAADKTSYAMIASDIIDHLPAAFFLLEPNPY